MCKKVGWESVFVQLFETLLR